LTNLVIDSSQEHGSQVIGHYYGICEQATLLPLWTIQSNEVAAGVSLALQIAGNHSYDDLVNSGLQVISLHN